MNIKINGKITEIAESLNVTDFIALHLNGKEPRGIAIAVNDIIIPKSKWSETVIAENDNIEIVHAVQGG